MYIKQINADVVVVENGALALSEHPELFESVVGSAPASSSMTNVVSADFTMPANGNYVIGMVTTATVATSSLVHINASLLMRN